MANFVTDIFLVIGRDSDLSTFILDTTVKGNDGNLYESSWRNKGKRLLGFKRNAEDEYIVTDLTIVAEDEDVPDDYAGCLITKDTKEKGLKKHILCYTRNSRKTAENAVTEILLVNPSKGESLPPHFTSLDTTLNDITICFKMESVPKVQAPMAPPRRPQVDKNQYNPTQSVQKSPVSGIEGVPFQINSKYSKNGASNDPIISSISMISIESLYSKYDYSFQLEKDVIGGT